MITKFFFDTKKSAPWRRAHLGRPTEAQDHNRKNPYSATLFGESNEFLSELLKYFNPHTEELLSRNYDMSYAYTTIILEQNS